jgi:hypothetical protein
MSHLLLPAALSVAVALLTFALLELASLASVASRSDGRSGERRPMLRELPHKLLSRPAPKHRLCRY